MRLSAYTFSSLQGTLGHLNTLTECKAISLSSNRLQAVQQKDGYILLVEEESSFQEEGTAKLLFCLSNLIQQSRILPIVAHAHIADGFLHHCLLWLTYSKTTRSMAIRHTPSYRSLVDTFKLACREEVSYNEMQARLIVEAPQLLNADQLQLVLHAHADSAWHHFRTYMQGMSPRKAISDWELDFALCIKVKSGSTYNVALHDLYYNEVLYRKDITHRMKPLEVSTQKVSSKFSKFYLFSNQTSLRVKRLSEVEYMIPLNLRQNTFESTYCENHEVNFLVSHANRILLKQIATEDGESNYLPAVLPPSVIQQENFGMQWVTYHPDMLHALSQKDVARWLCDTPIDIVHNVVNMLLKKHQLGEPYTLPGSGEVITAIYYIMLFLSKGATDEVILSVVNRKSYEVLKRVRSIMSEAQREEVLTLYKCCLCIVRLKDVPTAYLELARHYNVKFSFKPNIVYSPPATLFITIRALYLLSKLYSKASVGIEPFSIDPSYKLFFDKMLNEDFLNDGIFILCMLQSFVDVQHFNKAWSVALSIAGISFNIDNMHDGSNLSPIQLFIHDVFGHEFFRNGILNHYWKLQQSTERRLLVEGEEAVLSYLNTSSNTFIFLDKPITPQSLAYLFKHLFFLFVHEQSLASTQSSVRILPFACNRAYLDKVFVCFIKDNNKASHNLSLSAFYADFPQELKALLPIQDNSTVPYLLAYLLFVTLVHFLQDNNLQSGDMLDPNNVKQLFLAFDDKLERHERLMYFYDKNWNTLIKSNILPETFSSITNTKKRLNVLGLPNVQEMLFYAQIDRPMSASGDANRLMQRTA